MQKQCVKCGAMGNENDKYCTVCGAVLQQQEQQNDNTTQTEQTDTSPLSLGKYLLMFLITGIPIVNIIVLCIWAFGHEKNQNCKNFAKAALIFVGIGMVVGLVFVVFWFQMIWHGIAYGIHKYDLYDIYQEYQNYNDYHYAVPEEEWWHNMELPDESFSTVDTHIKQILIEENGVKIL